MVKSLLAITLLVAISILLPGCAHSALQNSNTLTSQEMPTELYLAVTYPSDGSIIASDKIEVKGRTAPEAVVSVNEEIAVADAQGIFAVTVPLEEGFNILEIVASDSMGNEARTNLIVAYVEGG